jgi:hypothetical protein
MALLRHKPAAAIGFPLGMFACPAVGITGMFLVHWAACRRTEHRAVHFPPACATVRDLVYALVTRHPAARMVSDTARASDKEIWGALCAIVGGEPNRPPDSFTRASGFT